MIVINSNELKIIFCITNYKKEKILDRAIRSCESQIPNGLEIKTIYNDSKKFNKRFKIFQI